MLAVAVSCVVHIKPVRLSVNLVSVCVGFMQAGVFLAALNFIGLTITVIYVCNILNDLNILKF